MLPRCPDIISSEISFRRHMTEVASLTKSKLFLIVHAAMSISLLTSISVDFPDWHHFLQKKKKKNFGLGNLKIILKPGYPELLNMARRKYLTVVV